MSLPADAAAAIPDVTTSFVFNKGSSKDGTGGWSSLIGVVTAICGNILISFALNTQRYAHLRLSRDQEAQEQEKRRAKKRKATNRGYGTEEQIAEARAQRNGRPARDAYTLQQPDESAETQPLIPRLHSKHSDSPAAPVDDEDNGQHHAKSKSYLKSPIWWLGITLMTLGETGNFLAYGFAPASIVSPLGVVALISNCIIAPLLLGEKFRWRDALGVLIATGGCVVVVLSASDSNPKLSPDKIWRLVTAWEFETYLGITIFLIVVLMAASNKYGHKSILIDLGLVGLFGGYTALSTKGVASLLTYTIWRVVTFPITYLLLAVLIFTAVMQIKYVNRALQNFNSTMVIPTQFVLFTLSVIIGSAILYRDFEREQTEDAIKFVSGCALTFFGVWCITSGRKTNEGEDQEGEDEEDAISLVDEERTMPEIREINGDRSSRQASFATGSATGSLSRRYSLPRYHEHTAVVGSLPRPEIRTSDTDVATQSTPSVPLDLDAKPLTDELADVPKGTSSAVHTADAAPLYSHASKDPQKKPPMHATTSEPAVPRTPNFSSSLRPTTPLSRTPSTPMGPAGHSPVRDSPERNAQLLNPNSARKLISRQSLVGLMPGPLTSPLSGSLAAIVADEVRRGLDRSPIGSLRRRKTPTAGQRPTDLYKPGAGSTLKRHSIASGSIDFDSEEAAQLRQAAGSPPDGRTRSLSATISEAFGNGSSSSKRHRPLGVQEQRRQRSHESAVEEVSASQELDHGKPR
ncbi:NIPA-like protein 2 [Fulvia fulva]|uniref:NIPA-like protein 2 n=1 Tax=Passalora fulva TaxID=5499 RepID=A0A9Q8PAY6_PASFU|nr:NIPA-like protein 2 [Fulvia fulva]KAK4621590.1 NIPA-like protein 2 [Fulvia fulva]KAK4623465.1 NIPA-like protein 2 [Fulvia fulva]UJO19129.1 NIPA-like protein 2 [Fulvia fulva]WPV16398.1 NIPA-like protein 2 [Fulvia fulva]WPV31646.1 NIPA-like protein 2 [Fulvia fulva]